MSCVNDDCFDYAGLYKSQISVRKKKTDFGDFASSAAKRAALYKKTNMKK